MFYKISDNTRKLVMQLLGNLEPCPLSFVKMQNILNELQSLEKIEDTKPSGE